MQPEALPQQEENVKTLARPEMTGGEANGTGKHGSTTNSNVKPQHSQNGPTNAQQFPPPKTDKPRPHVCVTCGRSFARLEHLKRHERSHTKEKPFECPECTRCFARRDLLLRHQQKLHMTNTTSSRPRNGARRESVSGASVTPGGNKVRKNSMAHGNAGIVNAAGVRPRANTISHIDLASLGLGDAVNGSFNRMNALGLGIGMGNGMSNPAAISGMSASMNGAHPNFHELPAMSGLPKLNTHALNSLNNADTLHTAPPVAGFGGFDLDQLFSPGTTIDPSQLHLGASTPGSAMPMQHPFGSTPQIMEEDGDLSWMRNWSMQFGLEGIENAIDESSPSRISSGESPGDYSDNMVNSATTLPTMPQNGAMQWPHSDSHPSHNLPANTFHMDSLGSGLPNLDAFGTMSPDTLQDPTPTPDNYFHNSAAHQQNLHYQQVHHHQQHLQQRQMQMQPEVLHGVQTNIFPSAISNLSSDSPSMSSSSMNGSARQSSVTSISTDSITDATRQALLATLAQPSGFGGIQRKYSPSSSRSPLSSGTGRGSAQGPNLPCTADLRRYVEAGIHFAHPHMPLLHIPTLSFDSIEYNSSIRSPHGQNNVVGGAGCLILAMAAIGALYEYDHPASKELFDAAKKMIGLYLEERRNADMSAAVNGGAGSAQHTPLWLVQAMLLNVIYGHQCGDKLSADIASNHCAALVSLARAADLAQPAVIPPTTGQLNAQKDGTTGRGERHDLDLHTQWLNWKVVEERKRCFFSVFILSNLLTTGYNQIPTIMNSEIMLDLPCDEELWNAENAQEWHNRGGLAAIEQNSVSFANALSTLLTANQRQVKDFVSSAFNSHNPLGSLQNGHGLVETDLRLSTFGCLVLINALHNYIWETRSRHNGRQWTASETESMFAHIEPALNAWQSAWKSNAHHKLERPNPFGLGPLSADSIPLLDLAFVHLYVNLGRTKEAFWRRDFDAMAEALANSSDIVQHVEDASDGLTGDQKLSIDHMGDRGLSSTEQSSPRRERHLRKAAFYAADSLGIACNFNLTYVDATAHELPIQSAICFFDCGLVLAEWVATIQDRVGRYLGVLGRDPVDFSQIPAKLFLEDEDIQLLQKIADICESLEAKRVQQETLLSMDIHQLHSSVAVNSMNNHATMSASGFGSKLVRALSMMLEKAVVWPVTHVMAKALKTLAVHIDQRAENSTAQR